MSPIRPRKSLDREHVAGRRRCRDAQPGAGSQDDARQFGDRAEWQQQHAGGDRAPDQQVTVATGPIRPASQHRRKQAQQRERRVGQAGSAPTGGDERHQDRGQPVLREAEQAIGDKPTVAAHCAPFCCVVGKAGQTTGVGCSCPAKCAARSPSARQAVVRMNKPGTPPDLVSAPLATTRRHPPLRAAAAADRLNPRPGMKAIHASPDGRDHSGDTSQPVL